MLVGGSTGRRRRLGSAGVVGLAVAALALSACSSSTDGSAVATTSVKPPAPAAQVTITAGDQASPTTPITIKASGGKITNVVVTNSAKGTVVKGDLSADGLTWTTTEPLGYGASYAVVADATNADGKQTEQKSTYTTLNRPRTRPTRR